MAARGDYLSLTGTFRCWCRKTFASTHGDHTVKIICIETGKVIQVRQH
jgi:hypothetical protein